MFELVGERPRRRGGDSRPDLVPAVDVVVVAYPGAELADIACVTSAFHLASRLGSGDPYSVRLVSSDGSDVDCDSGLSVRAHAAIGQITRCDTLIVSGGSGHEAAAGDPRLVSEVARLARGARRVASVCTGATVLAEAGLLDGHRATTHWYYADELARRYPRVRVDPEPVFIREGKVATSGGVLASLDLTLALVEEDRGPEVARRVSRGMVAYLQRSGDHRQLSMFTSAPRPDHAVLRTVVDYAVERPDEDLSAPALAQRANLSTRQLSRLFREHLDETPGAAVRRIRLELAARLLVTTDLPVGSIARRCGFASAETLRQAFTARYSTSPRTYRATRRGVGRPGLAPRSAASTPSAATS